MDLLYKSTRSDGYTVTASEAILNGLPKDGGLYMPSHLPKLQISMEELSQMTYQETAYIVMKEFLTDFTEEELKECISKAYDEKFDVEAIAPLVKADGTYFLELFHGSTIAFKDMALSILPHLMITSAKKQQVTKDIIILAATSGDTGKAALAGFADVQGTKIIVFYPKDGVSKVQELQMITQKGNNTSVIAIHGNFDDAQSGVKAMFENQQLADCLGQHGCQFSSANSINIGRLVPQVVYYVYAYAKLLQNEEIKDQEMIDVVVPTGNFGNILAAYFAKNMGVPIGKLVCASNENKVLFDFFQTGTYDKNRDFILTNSPSMDILISSNLERLIYTLTGDNAVDNGAFMSELKNAGKYNITADMKKKLVDFEAGYADEKEIETVIQQLYAKTGYVIDTHTAVAKKVCDEYRFSNGDARKCIIASTASPYKFARSVMKAIAPDFKTADEFELIDELEKHSGVAIPKAVEEIREASILHEKVCHVEEMEQVVKEILGIAQ